AAARDRHSVLPVSDRRWRDRAALVARESANPRRRVARDRRGIEPGTARRGAGAFRAGAVVQCTRPPAGGCLLRAREPRHECARPASACRGLCAMILATLWQLLDRGQKARLLALQLLSVLMAVTTVIGIAAILPFLTVLADPDAVDRSALLRFLFRRLGFEAGGGGGTHFALALGAVFIALVVVANLINLGGALLLSRFALKVGDS